MSTSGRSSCTRTVSASSLSRARVCVRSLSAGMHGGGGRGARLTRAGLTDGSLTVLFQRVLPSQLNQVCSFSIRVNAADQYERTAVSTHTDPLGIRAPIYSRWGCAHPSTH
jgi:hypothetical protein